MPDRDEFTDDRDARAGMSERFQADVTATVVFAVKTVARRYQEHGEPYDPIVGRERVLDGLVIVLRQLLAEAAAADPERAQIWSQQIVACLQPATRH